MVPIRVVLVAATLALIALSACGLGDGSSSRNASAMDGGVCIRDLEAIENLLAHPVACVNDGQCPNGAFCNTARGACDWQCTADSHCGPGNTCGCDGRCEVESPGNGPGAGVCERSAGLLASVSRRSCGADSDCPSGLQCAAATSTCEQRSSCTSNAQCPAGATCQGGVCQAAVCDADADCPSGVPCDLGTSRCLAFTPRSCLFDDQCPSGSRCDEGSRSCRHDCSEDADCGDGEACDCRGACVALGAAHEVPGDRLLQLEVAPSRTPLPAPTATGVPWNPRRLIVTLRAPNAIVAASSAATPVKVIAPAGLVVACGPENEPAATAYGQSCALTPPWTFAEVGNWRHAMKYVWVRPAGRTCNSNAGCATGQTCDLGTSTCVGPSACDADSDCSNGWHCDPGALACVGQGEVIVSSDKVPGSSVTALFMPPVPSPTEDPPDTVYPFAGEYVGSVVELGAAQLVPVAFDPNANPWDQIPPLYPPHVPEGARRFPVTAWATGTETSATVDFFDVGRSLSGAQKVRASWRLWRGFDWLVPAAGEAGPVDDGGGAAASAVALASVDYEPRGGVLRGLFWLYTPGGFHAYYFDLLRRTELESCTGACSSGRTCASVHGGAVCQDGASWADIESWTSEWEPPVASTVFSTRFDAWRGWLTTVSSNTTSTTPHNLPAPARTAGQTAAIDYLCYRPQQGRMTPLVFGSWLPVSGDLVCGNGEIPRGVELVYDADRPAPTSTMTMLASCLTELTALPPGAWPGNVTSAMNMTFPARTCFSAGHFYGALGVLLPNSAANEDLRGRLLSQWMQLHGFIASEGHQAIAMARAVSPADELEPAEQAAVRQTPTFDQLTSQMERGWNLLLGEVYGRGLASIDPDYRSSQAPSSEADVPLAVHVLEVAKLHLDLAYTQLSETRLASYDECRTSGRSALAADATETVGRALRYTAAVENFATESLHDVLSSSAGGCDWVTAYGACFREGSLVQAVTPVWQGRWQAAAAQYALARQRVLDEMVALEACENPLSITETTVPLYFGDVSGTSSQFFASSDYLLNGWAKPAVEGARAALEAARGSWSQQRDSLIQQRLSDQEAERRLESIAAQYGQTILDLCGLESVPVIDALGAFAGTDGLTADTCFLRLDSAECQEFVQEATSTPSTLAARTSVAAGPSPENTTRKCPDDLPKCVEEPTCPGGWSLASAPVELCKISELWPFLGLNNPGLKAIVDGYRTAELSQAGAVCGEVTAVEGVPVKHFRLRYPDSISQTREDAAEIYCTDSLDGRYDEPYVPDVTSHAECFRGQLGQEVLGLMGARQDIQIALAEWWDAQSLYDISAKHCDRLKDWQISTEQLISEHQDTIKNLNLARDIASAAANGIAAQVNPTTAGPVAAVQTIGAGVGIAFGEKIASAERSFQKKMRSIENEKELYTCYEEARKVKLRIDNAARGIERAIVEADRHLVLFNDLQNRVRSTVSDGNASLAREQGREVPPLQFHYWLDEKIDRFHKDFQWARSLTYLAMLSVEYEYQQSMTLREEVLKATHPNQLLDAIRELEQTQISRTINGNRPEESELVRSLALEILGLPALTPSRPGERSMTALQRFQERLWAPEYAVYDRGGRYVGQGIPFSLEPEGETKYACAERVWSVTATVQGDTLSEAAPNVPLMLLKRNHFTSQWCDGKGDGTALQSSSMQPVSELFHPEDRGGEEAAPKQYVTARMRPWFNVPRSEFYRDGYGEGASTELAGRGLYGEYLLLFPAEGLLKSEFPLEKVEDVLIRFDYLSVDNLQVTPRLASETVQ